MRLILVVCGAVATAMVAIVAIFYLTASEPGSTEPPQKVVSTPPAGQDSRADRTDRGPPTAPTELTSRNDTSQAASTQANPEPARASREDYADWALICPPDGSTNGCVIAQNHVQAETQQSIFAIQLRPSDDDGMDALLITPLNVRLLPGVAFVIGEEDRMRFSFRQCRRELCQADGQLQRGTVFSLLTAPGAQAIFELASGQTTTIDISLNGFSEAFAALKQKPQN